jgi:signal transduction histidine kinase
VDSQKKFGFVELFFLQDSSGDQTARSFGEIGHRGNRWWFKEFIEAKKRHPFISESYYSMTGNKPVSSVFHPVFDNGTFIGILGMDINFDYLQDFVSRNIYSKDLFAMIIDNDGVVIAHPDKEKLSELYNLKEMTRKTMPIDDLKATSIDSSGHLSVMTSRLDWAPEISVIVKRALVGEMGFMKNVTLEGKNCTLYYNHVSLPGYNNGNFAIILVRDNSTLSQTKLWILVFVILFSLLTILVFIILFHLSFRRVVLKPLRILTHSIKNVSLPETVNIDLKTDDEFQTLAETFNELQENLRIAGERLEEKVERRTAELKETNHRLSNEIEEHKKTVKKLVTAKETAEIANATKSKFLANISHELRTPMHGILGFAKLGISKIDTLTREKLNEFLKEIANSGERLLRLLNDLLDLSKLEAGKTTFFFERGSLSLSILKAIAETSLLAKEKKITMEFDHPDFPDEAEFDQQKMGQVLENLIVNSIRYSPENSHIHMRLERHQNAFRVSITDNGVGIPEIELEHIFNEFVQSSQTDLGAGGTGLGLSICRQIIEEHNGKIWAENNPRGGAILRFQIPISQDQRE